MSEGIFKRAVQATRAAVGVFSDVDQRRTWNLLSGVNPGGLGTPPKRYTRDFLASYSQQPWLHAAANKIAISIAMTEWKLYAKTTKPDSSGKTKFIRDARLQRAGEATRRGRIKAAQDTDELKEITSHPLLDMLDDANGFQTGLQMRKVTMLHIDLAGEAFWLKERDGSGMVVGVWPIPPDWVLNTPTPTNPFFRVGFRSWRGMIPDTEILWFSDTDPSNPYSRGTGTAQSIGDELETDEYTAKHMKAFFYNRAKPDLLIFPKVGNIRQPDITRLENDWMQSNQGFWKAFKPYFMTREVGVHEMDQDFRSLQMVQLRQFERDLIIQTFGLPPELLGILTSSNRATIDAADYLMARYVLRPRLEFLRSIMQEKLVPEYDDRLIIDYESPVAEDRELETAMAKSASWALSVNEWRKSAGQEHIDGPEGDLHAIPAGVAMVTLADAGKQAAEAHDLAMQPPPAPIIAPGMGGPPKPGQPKPGPPKPGVPAARPRPGLPPKPPAKPKRWEAF